jgi:hypothetical protein
MRSNGARKGERIIAAADGYQKGAVRSELRGKIAEIGPRKGRYGVDSCRKGELASLLYPEITGEIPRQLKSRVMASARTPMP